MHMPARGRVSALGSCLKVSAFCAWLVSQERAWRGMNGELALFVVHAHQADTPCGRRLRVWERPRKDSAERKRKDLHFQAEVDRIGRPT